MTGMSVTTTSNGLDPYHPNDLTVADTCKPSALTGPWHRHMGSTNNLDVLSGQEVLRFYDFACNNWAASQTYPAGATVRHAPPPSRKRPRPYGNTDLCRRKRLCWRPSNAGRPACNSEKADGKKLEFNEITALRARTAPGSNFNGPSTRNRAIVARLFVQRPVEGYSRPPIHSNCMF